MQGNLGTYQAMGAEVVGYTVRFKWVTLAAPLKQLQQLLLRLSNSGSV